MPNKFDNNYFNTTDLTLSVMARVADRLGLHIEDDEVSEKLYSICSDLESWPTDEGFGTSDIYPYLRTAEDVFGVESKPTSHIQHHYLG